MKKYKITYPVLKQPFWIVEAESVSQAITRAELERKRAFDVLTNNPKCEEYKEPKKDD